MATVRTLRSGLRSTKRAPAWSSATASNQHRRTVVVIPLSTAPRSAPPLMVSVTCSGHPAVAVIDQVRAIAKERLTSLIEKLSAKELESVEASLREILELD